MPVLVVGSVGIDHIKTQTEDHPELLGGSASYAAVSASFYAPVRLVGVVGNDFPPQHRALYEAKKIDLEGLEVADGETFRWTGQYEADMNNRKTLSLALNVFEHFSPKIPASYKSTDFVLLANIAPALQSQVLDQIEKPKFVVADTMDLWIEIARPDLLALLKRIDLLVLNDSEAKALTEEGTAIQAGKKLLTWGPKFVIVKKGEHGAILFSKEKLFVLPAFPLDTVFDPTGAGDCFVGALVGYCASKGDASFATLKEALVHATLVASFNVEAFSLRRLEKLTKAEIEARAVEFKEAAGLA
ncbi:Sugar or nucleoside kinase, ribokinase family [Verrucomicrobium sp. GAS474]|uniref:PfkB family carbohydrate kinase n=1 Tax=Verrucomicrobium sp. GAS474 TaxID=1882831 RepID=UPI00087B7DE9|nr:PfkB family carbohydrate kinase [Verrucomicrobium sp. GAS474]SDU17568.1 Sugar or nucleoside kinase, ribokinase family [Verrucomicrobium sp. GAS474]